MEFQNEGELTKWQVILFKIVFFGCMGVCIVTMLWGFDFGYFFIFLGFVPVFVGFFAGVFKLRKTGNWQTADARITAITQRENCFFPILTWKTLYGKAVEAESRKGSDAEIYFEGQVVPVFYDAEKPENFVLDEKPANALPIVNMGGFQWLFIGLGAVFMIIGTCMVVFGDTAA